MFSTKKLLLYSLISICFRYGICLMDHEFTVVSYYLEDLRDTDVLFIVDTSHNTSQYLQNLTLLGKKALPCFDSLRYVNNDIALITFGNTTKLEFGFGKCLSKSCLKDICDNIKARDENRRIGSALRYGKRLMKDKKTTYERIYNSTYERRQSIILLTFGVGSKERNIPIAKKILNNQIDLVIIGLGEEANKNANFLKNIAIQEEDTKRKKQRGQGLALVTSYFSYAMQLLEMGITFTCVPYNDDYGWYD